jgi:PST family polysaccharide transporter
VKKKIALLKKLAGIYEKQLKNFSYLSLLHLFNLSLPLLTFPYLIRALGAESYGKVILAQSIISFFSLFIKFGFIGSATKEVAIHRHDPVKLNEIVSAVIYIRTAFLVLAYAFLELLIAVIPFLGEQELLLRIAFLLCLEDLLYPVWYYLGVEKMKYITVIEVAAKSSFAILMFFFIHDSGDYLWMPGLKAVGLLVGGLLSSYLLFMLSGIKLVRVPFDAIRYQITHAIPFIIASISQIAKESGNALIIGGIVGLKELAYYDLAVKVVEVLHLPFYILNQTIYSHISRSKNIDLTKKILKFSLLAGVGIYIVFALMSEYVVLLLGGSEMMAAQPLMYILLLVIPIISVSLLLGDNMLVPMGYSKQSNIAVVYSAVFYGLVVLVLYISGVISMYSVSIVIVLASLFDLAYKYSACKRYSLIGTSS